MLESVLKSTLSDLSTSTLQFSQLQRNGILLLREGQLNDNNNLPAKIRAQRSAKRYLCFYYRYSHRICFDELSSIISLVFAPARPTSISTQFPSFAKYYDSRNALTLAHCSCHFFHFKLPYSTHGALVSVCILRPEWLDIYCVYSFTDGI